MFSRFVIHSNPTKCFKMKTKVETFKSIFRVSHYVCCITTDSQALKMKLVPSTSKYLPLGYQNQNYIYLELKRRIKYHENNSQVNKRKLPKHAEDAAHSESNQSLSFKIVLT